MVRVSGVTTVRGIIPGYMYYMMELKLMRIL